MAESEAFTGWAILERWRPVVGFEGLYEVSEQGRVRREGRTDHNMKAHPSRGYLAVQLWRFGKPSMCLVHCLVAEAFLGLRPDGHEVNHKNGHKHDNKLVNLEYVTRSGNLEHAYRTGLRQPRTDQLVAARRKPRVLVSCACGCGTQIETPDAKGRARRFISGHNGRRVA